MGFTRDKTRSSSCEKYSVIMMVSAIVVSTYSCHGEEHSLSTFFTDLLE